MKISLIALLMTGALQASASAQPTTLADTPFSYTGGAEIKASVSKLQTAAVNAPVDESSAKAYFLQTVLASFITEDYDCTDRFNYIKTGPITIAVTLDPVLYIQVVNKLPFLLLNASSTAGEVTINPSQDDRQKYFQAAADEFYSTLLDARVEYLINWGRLTGISTLACGISCQQPIITDAQYEKLKSAPTTPASRPVQVQENISEAAFLQTAISSFIESYWDNDHQYRSRIKKGLITIQVKLDAVLFARLAQDKLPFLVLDASEMKAGEITLTPPQSMRLSYFRSLADEFYNALLAAAKNDGSDQKVKDLVAWGDTRWTDEGPILTETQVATLKALLK
jgi:hypothetical protein